ncbi:MAG: VCBS repeat-containing protein [Pseudoxanthomonas sp.]
MDRTSRVVIGIAMATTAGTLHGTTAQAQGATRAAPPYLDATSSHVPAAAELHALDVALLDVDGDGDLDVVLAVENGQNLLYLNTGSGKLQRKDGAFGPRKADNEHVRTADFNGDGHADVVFVAEDDETPQLFLGDGKGSFRDVSDRLPARGQGNGLAVGDVSGDGIPDIVVGNTSEGKSGSAGPFLWLGDQDKRGYFIDATASHLAGLKAETQGVALADVDGDGDLDMVLANQQPPNRLLLNDGKGRFTEARDALELRVPLETREVHVFDATGDGHPDIVFFNITSNAQGWEKDPQTRLLVNDGKGRFRDETDARLPKHRFSSWGGLPVDFNGDGAMDLLVGAIEVPGFKPLQLQAWQNDGRGHFRDVTATVIPASMVGRSWSMAKGDLDGDGKPDVAIGGWRSQMRLLLSGQQKAAAGSQSAAATTHQASP